MILRPVVFALCACIATGLQAQLNVSLVSNLDYEATLNDIWGYQAPDGTEYALVGTVEGFSIVSLADRSDPREVAFVPGVTTVWRDIKTWGEFAYVVSDNSGEGMLIVDMSNLPDTVEYVYWQEPIPELGMSLSSCHNIFIDEYGLAYLAGSNLGSIIALDVKEDPWNPRFVLKTPGPYSHDVYVRDSIVYTSEIYDGQFFAYDISDINNIIPLGGAKTPSNFTHNTWLSDDSQTLFTTDERSNAFIGSYDISDWSDVRELDRFKPAVTVGEGVIPHNVHVLNDYLIISYYTDGVIIVDAARPDNLIEVGNYDTYIGDNGGFSGAWGAYPYLPSGSVLISDRQTGLYVLEPNYVRACYLEGVVKDAVTGDAIFGANIHIDSDEILLDVTANINGEFKTGKAVSGTYMIEASHPEYYPGKVEASFANGVLTEVEILLDPKPKFENRGHVISNATGETVPGANVVLMNDNFIYQTVADGEGLYAIADIVEGDYRIYAGVWGEYLLDDISVDETRLDESIFIQSGYYDDFHFDYGWTESGTASNGQWVRGVPNSGNYFGFQCNPAQDVQSDIGFSALLTGNMGGDSRDDGVQDGFTLASSPVMDLTAYDQPRLEFTPWLCVQNSQVPAYILLASNGTDTVVVDTIQPSGELGGVWRDPYAYILSDYLQMTDNVQVHFKAEDEFENNVVKAALDQFLVSSETGVSVSEVLPTVSFNVYPNPATTWVTVALDSRDIISRCAIYDNLGRRVISQNWPDGADRLQLEIQLAPGLYFVVLESNIGFAGTRKLVVD